MKKLFLLGLLIVAAQPAQAVVPENGEIVFEILRNGKPFGQHRVAFKPEGDKMRVLIDIEMEYSLGPVALFKYEHSNEELWKGNTILSMTSQTNDDGTPYKVDASWSKRGAAVEANGERYEAPEDLYSTSYWNPVALKADALLNTQKGQVEDIDVAYQGRDDVTVQGRTLQADHYKVEASLPLDVWYDAKTREWVGLKFKVRGSDIEYRRVTPVGGQP